MFVFGSFMNSIHANVLQVGISVDMRGILFNSNMDIPVFTDKTPDVVVLLSSVNKEYNGAGVLTVDPDSTDILPQKDLYRKFILDLIKNNVVGVNEDAFLHNNDFFKRVEKIKKAYPSARIVPLLFQKNYNKIDPYLLSRAIASDNQNVWIMADFTEISSSEKAVNNLRNAMLMRVIKNKEILNIDKLAVDNTAPLKTFIYAMHFFGANIVDTKPNYVVFKPEESSKVDGIITFIGFGDIMLDRSVRKLMDTNGLDYPFRNITSELKGVDYVFANFEGPIKEHEVHTSKSISFRFKPDVSSVVKNAGINIVSIANNHALDQGWGGRSDTMKFLKEAGVRYFGNPKNEAEGNTYIGQIGDKTIAFIGFDDTIFKIDGNKAREMIEKLKKVSDYVIVSVHWGVEYVHRPTERKQWLAHLFIDSGADAVIGHHPHVVQTMEIYNGKPIFYSLGNFVFDQYFSQDTQEGLGVGMIINNNKMSIYLLPYAIIKSQPVFMEDDAKTEFLEKFILWGNYDEDMENLIRKGEFML